MGNDLKGQHKSLCERNSFIEIIQKPAKRYSEPPKAMPSMPSQCLHNVHFNHLIQIIPVLRFVFALHEAMPKRYP